MAQRNLGAILLRQGDPDGARALTLKSIEILRGLPGEESDLATAQILRGEIAVGDGQLALAARILGRAETLAAAGGGVPMELRDYDRLRLLREAIERALGAEGTDALARTGADDDVL